MSEDSPDTPGFTRVSVHIVLPWEHEQRRSLRTAGVVRDIFAVNSVHAPFTPIQIRDLVHQVGLLAVGWADEQTAHPQQVCKAILMSLGQRGADRLDPETLPELADVAELSEWRVELAWGRNVEAVF